MSHLSQLRLEPLLRVLRLDELGQMGAYPFLTWNNKKTYDKLAWIIQKMIDIIGDK